MKTNLLIAAAVAALSLGATAAQAAPAFDVSLAPQSTDSVIQPAYYYGYYGHHYYRHHNYRHHYYNCYWNHHGYKVCY